ncbi:hypothetical protein RhiirA5_412885 [Rhizophagus irregularis]|uniref:Reverse transcriptase domain-containing protein n=1 Tax=Rhizophagus irregularis TaxID=588596 RepID=A0A2N0PXN2_9GLOM|nr:hypothetical protein RhiirA5_412885 [Rhizophagus irregularis]
MYTIDPTRINQLANDHYQNIVLSIYLTAQITIEELNATLKTLPNNKAPEPSGIVYELIRKLPSSFHKKLTVFYNYILDNGIIPSSWQDALLYPIPKPAWWDNNIQHTRPIVLLDTFQKVFVKIINARLNKYLSENSILQSNNLAGTQARLILYGDYLHSTNCHYRDPYDIINGIDQGIEYTAHLPTKIPHEHEDDTFQQKLSMKIQGYLDDTTWLTDNLNNLEQNLK